VVTVTGLPLYVQPDGNVLMSVGKVSDYPGCSPYIRSKIMRHNTSANPPFLAAPQLWYPSSIIDTDSKVSYGPEGVNSMGPAAAVRSDGVHTYWGKRDGNVYDIGFTTENILISSSLIIYVPACSANKWLIVGSGVADAVAPEIMVIDLSNLTIFSSGVSPSQLFVPPTIGLNGFWYTVDARGVLRAFDAPLPDGPLPPEELDEDDAVPLASARDVGSGASVASGTAGSEFESRDRTVMQGRITREKKIASRR
jgi:hypothetical protein